MIFLEQNFYHLYNRGNNKEKIFFTKSQYRLFLEKSSRYLLPHFNVFTYCLMPNHFHFLIQAKKGIQNKKAIFDMSIMLSSYAQKVNHEVGRTGSLFQSKTKAKIIESITYARNCFHYIHQNPTKNGMVSIIENWEFSSFHEYFPGKFDNLPICNTQLALKILEINKSTLYDDSYALIRK